MARTKKGTPPTYRRHSSGQAIVTLPFPDGRRKDYLLGPYGSEESKLEYARLITEWSANQHRPPEEQPASDLTLNELMTRFMLHAEIYYRRPDGTPTYEVRDFKLSFRPLKLLYGDIPARDFNAPKLKSVRNLLIKGYTHPKHGPQPALSRKVVNQRIGRIKKLFAWGVEECLVPGGVYGSVRAVKGLQPHRSEARETERVPPVPEAVVNATLPFLPPIVADMVRVQLLTLARPGEICSMRGADIDRSGPVWFYKPGKHKTAHRGHVRNVPIGPKAQAILAPYLNRDPQAYLFSPKEERAARSARRRQARKTKVQPSQARRRPKSSPKRQPGDHYTTAAFGRAISRALRAANTARACGPCNKLKPEERCAACQATALPHWHPHQLRHTGATLVRREAGPDAARAALGQRSLNATEVYAEADMEKVAELILRLG